MDRDTSLSNSSKAIAQKLSSAINESNTENSQEHQDNLMLLDAMLLIKRYVLDLEKGLSDSSIGVMVLKEDENGWPAFQIVIDFEGSQIGKLSIGSETRRIGPVIYIKNSFSDLVLELKKGQYSKEDELIRVLKRTFRSFTDEIETTYVYSKTRILEEIVEESELSEALFESVVEEKKSNEKIIEKCASGIGATNLEIEDESEKNLINSLDDLDFSV